MKEGPEYRWKTRRVPRDGVDPGHRTSSFAQRLEDVLNELENNGWTIHDICVGAKDAIIIARSEITA